MSVCNSACVSCVIIHVCSKRRAADSDDDSDDEDDRKKKDGKDKGKDKGDRKDPDKKLAIKIDKH